MTLGGRQSGSVWDEDKPDFGRPFTPFARGRLFDEGASSRERDTRQCPYWFSALAGARAQDQALRPASKGPLSMDAACVRRCRLVIGTIEGGG